ncbi:hypothetical protein PPL_05265 [Heterostelium album PN500]|uniref:FAD-binding domain-containing protein n=1 Tax=Heterostelium pallidum (strain ATCC 26659 / Pp 5 / PN500) TaxID=670386 RepID=D3BB79_HETP5|nr:hypothetical protein PPL_05265 [Heterostelium album PN500]EFA81286.1 hypothetical protein PPL_05265 [Heterostelium album PN500]|eukprot:XP_020433404.1 hypothetical protein PPL_05265 [Heterostelium album PN500]
MLEVEDINNETISIAGGGLAGNALAILLGKSGYSNINVYEKRPRIPVASEKVFTMALSSRGIKTLKEIGLFEEIKNISIPMRGRMVHLLNELFYSYAEKNFGEQVNFHFETRCQDFDIKEKSFTKINNKTGRSKKVVTNTIIGADGAYSSVRNQMIRLPRQEYSQSFMSHAYKEIFIPAGPNEVFPDVHPLLTNLYEDFETNPTTPLVTIKTYPWSYQSNVALIGDAAHAIVPFFGQGMNAALEDVLDLYNCLKEMNEKQQQKTNGIVYSNTFTNGITFDRNVFEKAYKQYQVNRKSSSDAIAEMVIENFVEMSDKVMDKLFQRKKKVEHLLEEKFPQRYISRYELISFSTTPYIEAQRVGEINKSILHELTKDQDTESDPSNVDLDKADELIKKLLSK